MMLKVGLVDDRPIDLDKMTGIVSGMAGVEIIFSTTSAEEAYRQIKKEEIDLFIADIEMPKLSGYELADIIHSHALNITVIFVTANSGYAVHAFEINVHDYIMKPYTKERLTQSIERLIEKTKTTDIISRLYIKNKNNEQIITYQTIKEIEGELRERDFLRSHRSFIINIHYVMNFSLYAKNSFVVTFEGIEEKAMITKEKVNFLQKHYF